MSIQDEYDKLVESYKASKSLSELEQLLRDIPLEVREEVLKKFDLYLVSQVMDTLNKSDHPLHKSINVDADGIKNIAERMDSPDMLRELLRESFDESTADLIEASLESNMKVTNQIYLDTVVMKLENSLYDEDKFSLEKFVNLGRTSVNNQIKAKLSDRMELNIYRDRNENVFSKDQLKALGLINPELTTLVELKNMYNGLQRANHLIGVDFRQRESLIKPENLGIDDIVMETAKKARELDLNIRDVKFDTNKIQSMIVDKFFENSNIDKNKFLRQIVDVDAFNNELIANMSNDSFSVTTRLQRDSLMDEMAESLSEYKIDFHLFNNSFSEIKTTELGTFEKESDMEKQTLLIPRAGAESVEGIINASRANTTQDLS